MDLEIRLSVPEISFSERIMKLDGSNTIKVCDYHSTLVNDSG